MKTAIIIFYLILLLFFKTEASETSGQAGAFLRYGLDARSESLGRAVVADTSSAFSVFFNPATLSSVRERQILTGMKILSLDRKFAYLLYSQSAGEKASLSLGLLYTGTGGIEGRDRGGIQFATYSYNENLFYLSFGIMPKEYLSAGVSAKILWTRLPEFDSAGETVSSLTFAYDTGIVLHPPGTEGFTVGLSARNIKGKNSWDSSRVWSDGSASTDYFPISYSAGISWIPVFNPDLGFHFETNTFDFKTSGYGAGIEWKKDFENKSGIMLRTGTVSGQLSFGLGYKFFAAGKKIIFDYAYTNEGITRNDPHSLSWRFFF